QPPLLEPLTLVRDEIKRLDHILEDFLQFARPREFVARPVEVVPVLNKVIDLMEGQAERRGVRVVRDLRPVPPIKGDEERLRQVLVNLALNSLEAVPEGGMVRLSCDPEDPDPERADDAGAVLIRIDDDGPGVPPELRDRIFEPFFTTKAQGSGLGLSIVHAIVSQHAGSIRIDDSPEGGARFEVRLPRAG
ncbi:MAG TPA: ATP-binding protein, partial [Anaeromyxobacteraceae bacterium]|nr:ATP-binding protein [Anaeromyxobacteraceae bacterium]